MKQREMIVMTKNEYLEAFGLNIKKHRVACRLTQTELARMVGYDGDSVRTVVSKIEHGQNDVPVSKLVAFAAALNVNPGDLIDVIPPADGLTADELELLELYRQLNAEGRRAVMTFADFAQAQYSEKNNPVPAEAEAG